MGQQQLSITLPDEAIELVRAKVASGAYATESDVILEGIGQLTGRDLAFESWLVDEAGPAYDRLRANPESAATADQVRARLRTLQQE